MSDKITLKQAVIVEGKYDKIKLSAVLDALIITTDGFGIYKNKKQRELIKELAKTSGIVVLTDSDFAGFQLRAYITDIASGGDITQVYIPDIYGKEKRKITAGKEGKIGVEGIDCDLLRLAFEQAGLVSQKAENAAITRQDLYELGLTGTANSKELRLMLLRELKLPSRLSTSALISLLNRMLTLDELCEIIEKIR